MPASAGVASGKAGQDGCHQDNFIPGWVFQPHPYSSSSYPLVDTLSFSVLQLSAEQGHWTSCSFPVGMGPPLFQVEAVS